MFKWGKFKSAAGKELLWKTDADSLTAEDWECIAQVMARHMPPFGEVLIVPNENAATVENATNAFKPLITEHALKTLVVDDVWTTGKTMRDFVNDSHLNSWMGCVAFARTVPPPSVYTMWQLVVN